VALRAQLNVLLLSIVRNSQEFEKRVRNISHTAKTPLQIAVTEIRRAISSVDSGSTPDEVKQHISKIYDAIRQSQAEMAGIYTGTRGDRRNIDLRGLLRSLVIEMTPLAEAQECRIELHLPEHQVPCLVCEDEIIVALRNLVDNAIKYSSSGSCVTIWAQRAPGDRVEIIVENYGIGIPDGRRDELLGLAGKGNAVGDGSGGGLGVRISLEILQSHAGTLDFESIATHKTEPGTLSDCLTRAIVTLPLSATRAHPEGVE